MRAFVTGASGFIGGRLARRLVREGHEVVALVRPTSDTRPLEYIGATLVTGDLLKPQTYDRAIGQADWVFHAAAYVDLVAPDEDRMLATNIDGTRMLLEAARRHEVPRTVHVSSVAAIGTVEDGLADETTERWPPYPNPYTESKHKADMLAGRMAADGLDVVRVNPSIVVGYGDPKTGFVIKKWLRRRIDVIPKTSGSAAYAHVEDVADGILLAARRGMSGQRYILSQANLTHEEMIGLLEELTGVEGPSRRVPMAVAMAAALAEQTRALLFRRRPKVSVAALRALDRRRAYSNEKAVRELGWAPEDFGKRLKGTLDRYMEGTDAERA
jgi:dihydroflavonol-4-reductase